MKLEARDKLAGSSPKRQQATENREQAISA